MQAEIPDDPSVGAFRPGTAFSRWALSRYLVGCAIGQSVGRALLACAVVLLSAAAALHWGLDSPFWAIVVFLAALGLLVLRAGLRAVLARLSVDRGGSSSALLATLVAETRVAVLRELRRLGLPGHSWSLPLLALRLLGRRRRAHTTERLRGFDLDRVVPPARVDQLYLGLQAYLPPAGPARDDG